MHRHQFRTISSSSERKKPTFFQSMLLLGLGLATISGCSKAKDESGAKVFGLYEIGKTTPADVGACREQDDQTYCSNNPSPKIGGGRTQTDLFFKGHAEDAPLVEILVGIWSCKAGQVSADLHKMLGEPTQVANKRSFWRKEEMTVIALLPMENDLCTLHFLDHNEKSRIAELFPGKSAAAETAPTKTAPADKVPEAPTDTEPKDKAPEAPTDTEPKEKAPADKAPGATP